MRVVLGVLAGVIVVFLCVAGIQAIGHMVDPPPADLDVWNREAMAAHIATLPLRAFLFVAGAWFARALRGAWVANAIGRRALGGWIVAVLVMVAALFNLFSFPHPAWMWAAGILLPLLGGWLAQRFSKQPL